MISASTIFTLAPGQVPGALATTPSGLTSSEAAARLNQYGRNELHEARRQPLYRKLLANFTHLMAILLWVAGAMAFVAGMPQLGVAVWLVVVLNGAFSFWQEYKAERATEALRRLLPVYARVLRGGEEQRDVEMKPITGEGSASFVLQTSPRFQALPVEVTVDGVPRDRVVLPAERDLHVEGLAKGAWRLRVTWQGEKLLEPPTLDLRDEVTLTVKLPEGAVLGQDADTRKRAGR